MRHQPIETGTGCRRAVRRDFLFAIIIAAVLSIAWALADWARLGRLILPDADDMVRLAQVRDWLAGQAFDDWTQYRMAPPRGAPMHWSRINDFGPAAIILALEPLAGTERAELAAVLLYPASLFCCYLFLSARIARRLWSAQAAPIATVLAAFAYPGTTIFIPGRIDHHALQAVLIQLAVLALMRGPTARNGLAAGLCVAMSLAIGLETVPQLVALMTVMFACWVVRGAAERPRLAGFGAALGGGTGLLLLAMRPSYWSVALCDAFTPASSTAMFGASAVILALAAATPILRDLRARLAAGGALGGVVLGAVLAAFPACLQGPYGTMHPFLRANFLTAIDEANGIFAQTEPVRAIALSGLLCAGAIAAVWMVARRPRRWPVTLPIAAAVAISALVMLAQVRGVYIGAPLAAPVLAGTILAARRRARGRTLALAGAWLASAGCVHAMVPGMVTGLFDGQSRPVSPEIPQGLCNSGDVWAQVDAYPAGDVMAAANMAAYLLGSTRHSTIGAAYHRNDRGNMLVYRYFLSPPPQAAAMARAAGVDYIVFCPGDLAEVEVERRYPGSVGAILASGRVPPGLRPLPLRRARLRFYRVGD